MKESDKLRGDFLKDCKEIATYPKIHQLLQGYIERQGFAGSANIPLLVYLVLLTGMLERPVSLLIKGPSGAGKSFSLRMGKQFIPSEAYEEFEGMSEKAIVYLKGFSLKHKHLIIGEASGMADGAGRTLLRQLLSEGKVRYATVESTDKGLKGSELPTLEGPCGLIMTTTATGIHPEDENRMLAVNIHESPDQIAGALVAMAEGKSKGKEPLNLEPWFALYRYIKLGPKKVVIPFAMDIAKALPTTHDKVKRDFPQILALIEASALLHSCTREMDENGAVIANADDYTVVYDLVNDCISEGLAKTVPDNIRTVVEAIAARTGKDAYVGLSNTQLAEILNRDPSVISRTTKKAIEDGYLENSNPGQGREAKLVIGGRKLPSGSALPLPEELFGAREVTNLKAAE
ncbi:hypothetical protein FJ970_21875 [Mesorhizobium sp. B2-1-8]|uniref:hypothetical protein n=1 Tax=Mesorhizobium sp. B2-1-8 TaxID=2589967 RepID=UPI001125EA71|nr:hypothetical protein [Mesorhizobium sp. B2-1-8]UCI17741.1 hypothetical protein FJ970_21875 [Mesorhizobium sp. B2-1-8]